MTRNSFSGVLLHSRLYPPQRLSVKLGKLTDVINLATMRRVVMTIQVASWHDDVRAHHGTILPVKNGFRQFGYSGNANTVDE
jgi:hypothetical protein